MAIGPTSAVCVGSLPRLLLTSFQVEHRIEDGHYAIEGNNGPLSLMDFAQQTPKL